MKCGNAPAAAMLCQESGDIADAIQACIAVLAGGHILHPADALGALPPRLPHHPLDAGRWPLSSLR